METARWRMRCYRECISLDDGTIPSEDQTSLAPLFHAYLRSASLLSQDGHYERAIHLTTRALANPKCKWAALMEIGKCHRDLRHPQDAERAFREGLSIADDPKKQVWFSMFLASVISSDKTRQEETRRLFEQALELDPNYEEARYNLGVALAEKGDYRGAQTHLERAIALDPNYSEAHAELGVVLMNQGNDEAARDHLERAIELAPNDALPHLTMGQVWLHKVYAATDTDQRNEHALTCEHHLLRSLELDPGDMWSRVFLVNLYWAWGRLRKAEEEGGILVELFPQSSVAHWILGDLLASTDRGRQHAEELLKRAIELDPEDSGGMLPLWKSLSSMGPIFGGASSTGKVAPTGQSFRVAAPQVLRTSQARG